MAEIQSSLPPGTPGEAEAQRYLGEQLQKAGLGAAGDGGGFVQALSLVGVRSRLVAAPTFRSLSTSIPVQIAVSSAELALHATTAVATSTLAEAEMVFVGYGITAAARTYLEPLIRGEAPPPYGRDGIPKYVTLKNVAVKKKLPAWEA